MKQRQKEINGDRNREKRQEKEKKSRAECACECTCKLLYTPVQMCAGSDETEVGSVPSGAASCGGDSGVPPKPKSVNKVCD